MSVFVTNDASHPVPVREQSVDASGNIKIHEQGTADVNVTNRAVKVRQDPITGGGSSFQVSSGNYVDFGSTFTVASALDIHMTSRVDAVRFLVNQPPVPETTSAKFIGPGANGQADVVLALTRPILFTKIACDGPADGDECDVSWVGDEP